MGFIGQCWQHPIQQSFFPKPFKHWILKNPVASIVLVSFSHTTIPIPQTILNTGFLPLPLYFLFGTYNDSNSSNPHIHWIIDVLVVSVVFGVWHFSHWCCPKPAWILGLNPRRCIFCFVFLENTTKPIPQTLIDTGF